MIKLKPSQITSGLLALVIYFLFLVLIIIYFNSRDNDNSKVYAKKDENRIAVALSEAPTLKREKLSKKEKPKKNIDKKLKSSSTKKVIKEKIVKKNVKKEIKTVKPKKKVSAKDLFANVNTTKKSSLIKITDKPIKTKPKNNFIKVSNKKSSATEHINKSLKGQKKGIDNAYLAKVQSMLEGWPAQSEYAGEKVKVILHIRPSGFFEFKIKSASRNWDFNRGLTEYLEELQSYGFGKHNGGRTYHFEAEFIAKG